MPIYSHGVSYYEKGNRKLVVPWPEFGDSLRMALVSYCDDIENAITKEAERAAKQCRKDIQETAPKRSGDYAKSWAVQRDVAYHKRPAFTVHANAPGYRLAHLLERAHRIANQYGDNWGNTSPQPHIEKAADKNGALFLSNVTKIIKDLS